MSEKKENFFNKRLDRKHFIILFIAFSLICAFFIAIAATNAYENKHYDSALTVYNKHTYNSHRYNQWGSFDYVGKWKPSEECGTIQSLEVLPNGNTLFTLSVKTDENNNEINAEGFLDGIWETDNRESFAILTVDNNGKVYTSFVDYIADDDILFIANVPNLDGEYKFERDNSEE